MTDEQLIAAALNLLDQQEQSQRIFTPDQVIHFDTEQEEEEGYEQIEQDQTQDEDDEKKELIFLLSLVEQFYEYEIDEKGAIIIYIDQRICSDGSNKTPILNLFIKINKDGYIQSRRMKFTCTQFDKGFIHPHISRGEIYDWKSGFCFGNYNVKGRSQVETLRNLLPVFERFLETQEGNPYVRISELKTLGVDKVSYNSGLIRNVLPFAKNLFKIKIDKNEDFYKFDVTFSEEFDQFLINHNYVSYKIENSYYSKLSAKQRTETKYGYSQIFKNRIYQFEIIPDTELESFKPEPCGQFKNQFKRVVIQELISLINKNKLDDRVKNNLTGIEQHSEDLSEIPF